MFGDTEQGSETSYTHAAWPKVSPKVTTTCSFWDVSPQVPHRVRGTLLSLGPNPNATFSEMLFWTLLSTLDANGLFRLHLSSMHGQGDSASLRLGHTAHQLPWGVSPDPAQRRAQSSGTCSPGGQEGIAPGRTCDQWD